jgi:hypothetical protein
VKKNLIAMRRMATLKPIFTTFSPFLTEIFTDSQAPAAFPAARQIAYGQ